MSPSAKKTAKYSVYVLAILVILAAIPVLIPDDDYLPEVSEWLDAASSHPDIIVHENSFYGMVGFQSPRGKDIFIEGSRTIDEVNRQIQLFREGVIKPDDINSDLGNDNIKLTKEWSGQAREIHNNPVSWLRNNKSEYNKYVKDNRELLNRYIKITETDKYSNTEIFDYASVFAVRYSEFMNTARLDYLSILYEYIYKSRNNALRKLNKRIMFSRMLLVRSHNLLEKMIAVEMVKMGLDTYSHIAGLKNIPVDKLSVKRLNKEELSMKRAAQGELLFTSSIKYIINKETDYKGDIGDYIEYMLQKIFIKPRRMINVSYERIWSTFSDMSKLPLSQRGRFFKERTDNIKWWHYLRDPIGTILIEIAVPDYFSYTDRVDHLDAYIYLVNLKSDIISNNIPLGDIGNYIQSRQLMDNPGYHGSKLLWDADKKELTYSIPEYEDKRIPSVRL